MEKNKGGEIMEIFMMMAVSFVITFLIFLCLETGRK